MKSPGMKRLRLAGRDAFVCFYLGLTESVSIIIQSDDDLVGGGGNELLEDAEIAIQNIIESIYPVCDSIKGVFLFKDLSKLVLPQEIEMAVFGRQVEGVMWSADGDDFVGNLPHKKGTFPERILAGVTTFVCIAMAVTAAVFTILAFTGVDTPALPFIQAGLCYLSARSCWDFLSSTW